MVLFRVRLPTFQIGDELFRAHVWDLEPLTLSLNLGSRLSPKIDTSIKHRTSLDHQPLMLPPRRDDPMHH